MWLKAGVRPPRSEAEGGGRKLLSYWSQWGRLLRDGLVYRRWEHEHTGAGNMNKQALHDDPSAGVTKTLEKVRRRFCWHGLREDMMLKTTSEGVDHVLRSMTLLT